MMKLLKVSVTTSLLLYISFLEHQQGGEELFNLSLALSCAANIPC